MAKKVPKKHTEELKKLIKKDKVKPRGKVITGKKK